MSATTSWMTVRAIRFFSRASVVGAVHTVLRSAASLASDTGSAIGVGTTACLAFQMMGADLLRDHGRPPLPPGSPASAPNAP